MEAATLTIGLDAQEEQQPAAPPLLPRLWRWGMIVGEFGAVQVAVQAAGALAGFIIVRSLAKPEYALYAVANAGIAMFNMLADLGVSVALRSIGGEVHADRTAFSRLIATIWRVRKRFAIFAILVSFSVTAWMLVSNGASRVETAALCAIFFAASVPVLATMIFREASLMLGNYRKVQSIDFAGAGIRLVGVAAAFSILSALLATAVTAVANWIQWLAYRRRTAEDFDFGGQPDDKLRGRVLAVTRRVMPNTVFYCFQGQITYVLLTIFGTTTGLADVAALGRIAALLGIFGVVFNNVLAPRFARCQSAERLPRLYAALVGLTAVVLAPFLALAWFFPQGLLWILGDSYRELQYELFLIVVASCLSSIGVVMISLNYSHNWLRWYSFLNIPSILAAQAACIALLDLSTVRGVLWFSIVSAIAPVPVYLLDAWRGFRTAADMRAASQ